MPRNNEMMLYSNSASACVRACVRLRSKQRFRVQGLGMLPLSKGVYLCTRAGLRASQVEEETLLTIEIEDGDFSEGDVSVCACCIFVYVFVFACVCVCVCVYCLGVWHIQITG